jgi:putative ABC transport system permease protein
VSPLRHSLRLLLKSPGFTITAVLILGLGIGANTAVFSLIDAVILNATPFPQADRLVRICQPQTTANQSDVTKGGLAYPGYVDLARDQHSFETMSVSSWDFLDLSGRGAAQRLTAIYASPSLFKITNLPFILGRPFTEAEDQSGGPLVVVLSEPVWRSRFHADPNIIGQN